MKKQTRAFAFGIITVLLWSTVASAFKLSLRYLEPIQLLLYATATSVITLFLILLLQGKLRLLEINERRSNASRRAAGSAQPPALLPGAV